MKITQKKVDGGKLLLECVASTEDVAKAFNLACMEYASMLGLKPDRNKTVEEAVCEKAGVKDKNLDSLLHEDMLKNLVPMALNKKDISPLFPPTPMLTSELKRGSACSFTMRVSPKPFYELSSYDPVEITVPPFTPDLSQVDAQMAEMAETYASFETAEAKPIEKGDTCLITIDASVDGVPMKGLNTGEEGRPFTAGEGYMPEQFEAAILGMQPGETKTFTFEGPSWDADGNNIMEIVDCTVKVLEIQNRVAAKMDDEWISKNLPMYRSAADLRKSIEDQYTRAQRGQYNMQLRNIAASELAKRFQGKIEDAAYESVSQDIQKRLRQQAAQANMTWDQFVEENGGQNQFSMLLMMQTRQEITTGLALDALFRKKKLVVSEEDITDACMAMVGDPRNVSRIRKELEETSRSFVLREAAERTCAAKWLVEHAIIHEQEQPAAQQ